MKFFLLALLAASLTAAPRAAGCEISAYDRSALEKADLPSDMDGLAANSPEFCQQRESINSYLKTLARLKLLRPEEALQDPDSLEAILDRRLDKLRGQQVKSIKPPELFIRGELPFKYLNEQENTLISLVITKLADERTRVGRQIKST